MILRLEGENKVFKRWRNRVFKC